MKLQWYFLDKGKYKRLERAMQRRVKSLYRFCKRHGLPYADIYILSSEGNTTLNIRAKDKKGVVVVNDYAFVRKEI